MESTGEINRIVEEYADTIKRICYSYTKNYEDTQDIMQTVFLKYLKKKPVFENPEIEKAWIIRVTINSCKDTLKQFFRKMVPLQEILPSEEAIEESEDLSYVRNAVQNLPSKYRDIIYLYYYEEYSAVEIAGILHKNPNTIYTRLKRGRELLKDQLGGDLFGE